MNVSIVSGANTLTCDPCLFKNEKTCIRISPKCGDETEEAAVYLSLQHIQKLQLQPMGKIHTKKYGILNKYSGIKMRLEGSHPSRPPMEHDVYCVPDGYVYELPAVFSSARMVPSSPLGIPERQGIVHRELFHDHAIISHKSVSQCHCLYCSHCAVLILMLLRIGTDSDVYITHHSLMLLYLLTCSCSLAWLVGTGCTRCPKTTSRMWRTSWTSTRSAWCRWRTGIETTPTSSS